MFDDWNPWRIAAGSCMTPREVRDVGRKKAKGRLKRTLAATIK